MPHFKQNAQGLALKKQSCTLEEHNIILHKSNVSIPCSSLVNTNLIWKNMYVAKVGPPPPSTTSFMDTIGRLIQEAA